VRCRWWSRARRSRGRRKQLNPRIRGDRQLSVGGSVGPLGIIGGGDIRRSGAFAAGGAIGRSGGLAAGGGGHWAIGRGRCWWWFLGPRWWWHRAIGRGLGGGRVEATDGRGWFDGVGVSGVGVGGVGIGYLVSVGARGRGGRQKQRSLWAFGLVGLVGFAVGRHGGRSRGFLASLCCGMAGLRAGQPRGPTRCDEVATGQIENEGEQDDRHAGDEGRPDRVCKRFGTRCQLRSPIGVDRIGRCRYEAEHRVDGKRRCGDQRDDTAEAAAGANRHAEYLASTESVRERNKDCARQQL